MARHSGRNLAIKDSGRARFRLSGLRLGLLSAKRMISGRATLHLYCVGTPKSGTHSLAAVFANRFRVRHEPGHRELIYALSEATEPQAEARLERLFRIRRLAFDLDLESSHVLAPFAPVIARVFPEARFILPVREPGSWLESMLDELHFSMRLEINQHWWRAYDYYFGPRGASFPDAERCLERAGLYSVDQLLGYWLRHHRALLSEVPRDRLLVLPTHRIQASAQELADFSGVSVDALDMTSGRSYVRRERSGLIDELGRDYINAKLEALRGQALQHGLHPEWLQERRR